MHRIDGRACFEERPRTASLLRACGRIPSPIIIRVPGESRGPWLRRTNFASVGKALRLCDAQASAYKWIPAFAGNATSDLRPRGPLPIFPQALSIRVCCSRIEKIPHLEVPSEARPRRACPHEGDTKAGDPRHSSSTSFVPGLAAQPAISFENPLGLSLSSRREGIEGFVTVWAVRSGRRRRRRRNGSGRRSHGHRRLLCGRARRARQPAL
jgi:hypothetical protein